MGQIHKTKMLFSILAVFGVAYYADAQPTAEVSYSTTEPTNQEVVATVTLSDGTVTSEGGATHVFTENGSWTFEFTDDVGNTGSIVAEVAWIIKSGDVNADNTISLADAILVFQVISGLTPLGEVYNIADVDADGTIGLTEAIYILQAIAGIRAGSFDIEIQVSPSTLNIQSEGQVVTVHTNLVYSIVLSGAVTLNGIPIEWWKADNQGNFVAKFEMDEVKALADKGELQVPGENELTLIGLTTEGAEFTGTQTITVINIEPTGSGGE